MNSRNLTGRVFAVAPCALFGRLCASGTMFMSFIVLQVDFVWTVGRLRVGAPGDGLGDACCRGLARV